MPVDRLVRESPLRDFRDFLRQPARRAFRVAAEGAHHNLSIDVVFEDHCAGRSIGEPDARLDLAPARAESDEVARGAVAFVELGDGASKLQEALLRRRRLVTDADVAERLGLLTVSSKR